MVGGNRLDYHALAHPSWGIRTDIIQTNARAVIIALDISQSMDAQDITPSRLERAKLITRGVLENLSDTFIGIVPFAGNAFVQLPLTNDKTVALIFLDALSSQSISNRGQISDAR